MTSGFLFFTSLGSAGCYTIIFVISCTEYSGFFVFLKQVFLTLFGFFGNVNIVVGVVYMVNKSVIIALLRSNQFSVPWLLSNTFSLSGMSTLIWFYGWRDAGRTLIIS